MLNLMKAYAEDEDEAKTNNAEPEVEAEIRLMSRNAKLNFRAFTQTFRFLEALILAVLIHISFLATGACSSQRLPPWILS